MPKIEKTIEINATKDRVWEVISDLDNEPEYWYGTRDVKTISRNGNTIRREIIQNFRNHRISQEATLRPKDSIEIKYLKGLTEGIKIISVEPISKDKQRLNVLWDVHFRGFYKIMTPIIKRHTAKGTVNALERIKRSAENRKANEVEEKQT